MCAALGVDFHLRAAFFTLDGYWGITDEVDAGRREFDARACAIGMLHFVITLEDSALVCIEYSSAAPAELQARRGR